MPSCAVNSRQKGTKTLFVIEVKLLCKSIITTKEALLRFTVVSFLGKLIFNGVQGHFYTGIKTAIFKTLTQKVSIPECDLAGTLEERSTFTLLPVRWLSKNFLFSKLCVHKPCSQCSCSCVETLVIRQAKFHIVSSILSMHYYWKLACSKTKLR